MKKYKTRHISDIIDFFEKVAASKLKHDGDDGSRFQVQSKAIALCELIREAKRIRRNIRRRNKS